MYDPTDILRVLVICVWGTFAIVALLALAVQKLTRNGSTVTMRSCSEADSRKRGGRGASACSSRAAPTQAAPVKAPSSAPKKR